MHILRQSLRLEHEQNDLTAESEILRSAFVLPSFCLRSAFAYCPLIVHRLSIDCPSFRWGNNVESMD